MSIFSKNGQHPERLLWTRDLRFVRQLARSIRAGRVVELDAGALFIAPERELSDLVAARTASELQDPEYGLVTVDDRLPLGDRYVVAMSAAVQLSGIAGRVGMGQTVQLVSGKSLDYFFACRNLHGVEFQPIVELAHDRVHEYECLFRPLMPNLPRSISSIVQAAIDTDRSVELDSLIFRTILSRAGELQTYGLNHGKGPLALAINLSPASLLDPRFDVASILQAVEAVDLDPERITLECTEQQSVPSIDELAVRVRALRDAGFGFAVDDAGAGYASFSMVAAIRPSVIKIDRAIVSGVASDDAKQALVEAFLSFGRRIGASITAEGIEEPGDLERLVTLGVEFGQGFLLGRPSAELADVPATSAVDAEGGAMDAAGSVLTDLLSRRGDPFRLRAS